MLTEAPSRGGRNCCPLFAVREYGLRFAGGISMNGNMAEYITAHAQSRTPVVDRVRAPAGRAQGQKAEDVARQEKPEASQAERDAILDDLTGAPPAPERREA